MARVMLVLLIFVALISIVQSRFRMLNYLLSIPLLRKFSVSMGMRIPFIRDKMLPSI